MRALSISRACYKDIWQDIVMHLLGFLCSGECDVGLLTSNHIKRALAGQYNTSLPHLFSHFSRK
jgi:hypothetical protein